MDILVVDDDPKVRTAVADLLRQIDHQVEEAGSVAEAIGHLEKSEFHVVLSDVRMPGKSGIDLLWEIKKRPGTADIYVVLFTAFGDKESILDALRAGAYDYLEKPIDIKELVKIVERVEDRYVLLKQAGSMLKAGISGAGNITAVDRPETPCQDKDRRFGPQGFFLCKDEGNSRAVS